MKPRSPQIPKSHAKRSRAIAADAPAAMEEIDRELAEARVALHVARRQIDAEVERRQRIEDELKRHVTQERERMRKKLHDGLGQVLTSVSFLASSLRARMKAQGFTDTSELDEIMGLIQDAIAESRDIAAAFETPPRTALAL